VKRMVVLAVLLSGCMPPDGQVPPFARVPYQEFSKDTVAAIALREWRLFGARDVTAGDTTPDERENGLWQRIGEYWWNGLDLGSDEGGWTGRHDALGRTFPVEQDGTFAWSAAFVSYVMRISGAGPRFPYAPDHAEYINAAARGGDWVVAAERPERYAPEPGDLVCRARSRATGMRFDALPAPRFPSHCDIVVSAPVNGAIAVIGGNVANTVGRRFFAVDPDGRLAPADPPWLTVLRVGLPPVTVAWAAASRSCRAEEGCLPDRSAAD
jgi:hypothetical protein